MPRYSATTNSLKRPNWPCIHHHSQIIPKEQTGEDPGPRETLARKGGLRSPFLNFGVYLVRFYPSYYFFATAAVISDSSWVKSKRIGRTTP